MSAGCRCGRGSGTVRPDSFEAMPGSSDGTVRLTAVGSLFAGGRIAANGATGAPCARSGRRRSGRPAPRSRGRTPARCARRSGRFVLPSGNRRLGPRRERTVEPERRERVCPGQGRWKGRRLLAPFLRLARRSVRRCAKSNRRMIDRANRRPGRKGAGESCRSGRRHGGVRMRGRAARRSAATAVSTMGAEGTTVVVTVVATGVEAAEGAEEPRQREGSFSMIGRVGTGGFAGE